jgi:hypothetical protein
VGGSNTTLRLCSKWWIWEELQQVGVQREREKVIVDLQEKKEKVFAMIFFRKDDL